MPTPRLLSLAVLLALLPTHAPAEPLRYSGSLMDQGVPAEGAYGLRMAVYDAPKGGHRIGREITLADVAVKDGGFATEVDFGLPLLTLQTSWLQVEVASSDGRFEALGAREALDPKMMKAGVCWDTTGNSGTLAGTNFLGTLDNQQLDFKVNNIVTMSLRPGGNVIGGVAANSIAANVLGATIGGGGPHIISDSAGTIGGGRENVVGNETGTVFDAQSATVGGGRLNTASGLSSVVSGGESNQASAPYAVVAGGENNRVSGDSAAVAGGRQNAATGFASHVAGGYLNCAGGFYSWSGGFRAKVRPEAVSSGGCTNVPLGPAGGDQGTFIWADAQSSDFVSSGTNQFLVRAQGGVGINGTPQHSDAEFSIYGVADDAFGGFVEFRLIPTPALNGNAYESIELGAGKGGAGVNDATFRIAQRNASGGYTEVLNIASNGVTSVVNGTVGTVSDARLKKNIHGIAQPLDTLLGLRGHVFEYFDPAKAMNAPGPRMGFIAQEVQQTLPSWVTPREDGYLQVSAIGFEALAVEAIRELADENVALQAENADLRDAQAALANRLAAIEAQLSQRIR